MKKQLIKTPAVSFTILLFLLFCACILSKDGTTPATERPTAVISALQTAMINETVNLSAELSSGNGGLTLNWELNYKPSASSSIILNAESSNASIITDAPGQYQIQLIVSSNGISSLPAIHHIAVFAESPETIFVNAANSGIENGTEAAPFNTIQEAVNAAENGFTIKVAEGIYNENVLITGTKGMFLIGGYQNGNFSTNNPNTYVSTICASSSSLATVAIDYSGNVTHSQQIEISGFTIRNGQRGVAAISQGNGGICYIKISSNIIQNNRGLEGGGDYGGGVYIRGMVPEIINNIISGNSCGKGGGLAIDMRDENYNVLVADNTIENNEIHRDHGGGFYAAIRKGIIKNSTIKDIRILESWGWGGGLIIDGGQYNGYSETVFVQLSGNIYIGNSSPSAGSGLFIDEGANIRMKNELIYANITSSGDRHGAFYVDGARANSNAKTIAENCTIAGNTAPDGSFGHAIVVEGGSEVIIKNSIFWNRGFSSNESDFFVSDDSSLTISYSIYASGNDSSSEGAFSLANSFTSDPLFVDISTGNLYLKSTVGRWNPSSNQWIIDAVHSPAIDAGDPASSYTNEPAPNGSRVNIGAYANTVHASKSQ